MKTSSARYAAIFAVTAAIAMALTLTPQRDLHAADDDSPEFTHEGIQRMIDSEPAIIDLEVSAPDTRSAGRSYTFVDSAGAATVRTRNGHCEGGPVG